MRARTHLAEFILLACLLALVALAAAHPLYAVDFFWHLKLGEWIDQHRRIPGVDLFSAAEPDRPYTQFNWLWEWSVALLTARFGLRGVRIEQALVLAASFGLFYRVARARLRSAEMAFACTALGFVLFEDRFQERPSALAFGFSAALYPLLLDFDRWSRRAKFVSVGAIGLLWANLHGGESLLLPLSMLAIALGGIGQRVGRIERFALFALSLACLCASPGVSAGLWHWSAAIGPQIATGNEEWQPTYTMLANGFRPSFALIALGPSAIGIAYAIERWRARQSGLDARELLLCGGYWFLSEQAVRNAFLCLLPLLFMLQRMAAGGRRRVVFAGAGLLLTAIAAEDALPYAYGGFPRIAELLPLDLSPGAFPELSADYLVEAGIEGGIINDGRFGGYLIWRAWPRCSVFADSRHHLSSVMWPVFNAIHDPLRRPAGIEAAFAKWGTELTAFRGPTFPLGAPAQFRLLYKAGDQEIYQDLRGRHAALNLARTRAWLSRQGVAVPDDPSAPAIPSLASAWGAARYLELPYQRLRAREATASLADPKPEVRGHGAVERGELLYEVGRWGEAGLQFERASELLPESVDPIYDAALSYFAAGDAAGFQRMDSRLIQRVDRLSVRKRQKLRLLRAENEQRKRLARDTTR